MADDLATLSLRIENEQAIADAKATGAAMDEMGAKGEGAAKKIAASSNPVSEAIKKQAIDYTQLTARASDFARAGATAAQVSQMTGVSMAQAAAAVKAYSGTVSRAEIDVEGLKAAQAQLTLANMTAGESTAVVGDAFKLSGAHAGRLREGLASMVAMMTGIPPLATRIASTVGVMTIGMNLVLPILLAIGAAAWVWDKMTDGARKAMDAADKLATSYIGVGRVAGLGMSGQVKADLEDMNKGLEAHAKWLGFIIAARVRLGGLGDIIAGALAPGHVTAIGDLAGGAAAAEQQRVNEFGLSIARDNEERVRRAKEAEDRNLAAARKAQDDFLRYQALMNSTFGGNAPNEMTSAQRAAWLANQHGRVMTDTELSAITGPMAQSVVDEVKTTTAAAVDLAVRAYKEGTGQVLADAAREIAARNKRMLNEMQRDLATFFTDIFSKGIRSFGDLFASIRDMFLRLVADMVAANLVRRVAGVLTGLLGSLAPATAGAQAATGFAAEHARALGLAGAGAVGGLVGYGVGSSIGSPGMGALGGAASGALIGNMMLPGIGAVIGGLAGFAGGLIGGARAAREHAKALAEAQAALKVSFDSLRATVAGNTLGQALAQNASDLQKFLLQINAALPGRANEAERNRERAEATTLFGQLADQLKARSAQALQYTGEDYQVRLLAAQGQDKAAAALKLEHDQARERKALIDSFGAQIDATEQATLALADQTLAQEKLKVATDAAATSALNMVSGYRLQAAVFGAMNPRGAPGTSLSTGSGDLTVKLTLSDGTVLATTVLKSFKTKAQKQFGDSSKWSEIQ